MKKIIVLALSLIFALSLTACGNGSNADANGNTSGNANGNGSSLGSTVDSAASGAGSVVEKAGDAVGSTIEKAGNAMTGTVNISSAKITADEAKVAALKHAGLSEADVTGIIVDLDRDDGVLKYEVDFYSGGVEYDYDINAENGNVISADRDHD